jgi:ParB-like chromosome segregation protein Spo0J
MDLVFAPSQIEIWPIDRLRPYVRNAKIHGTDQVAKIAASMAKFGWTVPCMVADDGELIAGHGRVLAATMLGLTDVPVIRLSHLDEAERRAYRIADNKLTELGEWNEAMLRDEIAGLLAEDFDMSLLGIGYRISFSGNHGNEYEPGVLIYLQKGSFDDPDRNIRAVDIEMSGPKFFSFFKRFCLVLMQDRLDLSDVTVDGPHYEE